MLYTYILYEWMKKNQEENEEGKCHGSRKKIQVSLPFRFQWPRHKQKLVGAMKMEINTCTWEKSKKDIFVCIYIYTFVHVVQREKQRWWATAQLALVSPSV